MVWCSVPQKTAQNTSTQVAHSPGTVWSLPDIFPLSFSPSLESPVPGICLGLEIQLDVYSVLLLIHLLFHYPAFDGLKENAPQREVWPC